MFMHVCMNCDAKMHMEHYSCCIGGTSLSDTDLWNIFCPLFQYIAAAAVQWVAIMREQCFHEKPHGMLFPNHEA